MLTLKVLNSDASLNNFQDIGNASITPGEDVTIIFQIYDSDKELRYIPIPSATFETTLLLSDQTTLTLNPTLKFSDQDESIVSFDLTAAQTELLVSQDVSLKITESAKTKIASLQQAISMSKSGCR